MAGDKPGQPAKRNC